MRRMVLMLVVLLCGGVAWGQGVGRAVGMDLPGEALGMAVSGETGMVAVAFPNERIVRGYPRLVTGGTLAGAVEYAADGAPVALVHKRVDDKGYFLVLTYNDWTVHVLDDATLQPVARIVISGERPVSLAAAPRADVPWAYYVYGDKADGRIGRLDLKAMKDEGTLSLAHQEGNHGVGEVAVSADGRTLYGRQTSVTPQGLRSFRVAETAREGVVRVETTVARHEGSEWYVPDWHGQFVASGNVVLSGDLAKRIAEVRGLAVDVLREKPVLLTASWDEVIAYSTNTFTQVGSGLIPFTPAAPAAAGQGQARRPQEMQRWSPRHVEVGQYSFVQRAMIEVDEKRGVVVGVRSNRAAVMPLAELRLKEEPVLAAEVSGETSGVVGRDMKLSISAVSKGATVTLTQGPAGMHLVDGTLTWTPSADQVGLTRVGLRVAAGGIERVQEVGLTVTRPNVVIGFTPDEFQVAPDGKVAVALGNATQTHVRPGGIPVSRLVLADLERPAVLADRTMPFRVQQVAVDGHHVYATSPEADALYVLSRKDLSDVRQVPLPGRPWRVVAGGGVVHVSISHQQGPTPRVRTFTVPRLEPAMFGASAAQIVRLDEPVVLPAAAGGLYVDGALWSAEGKVRLLVKPVGVTELVTSQGQRLVPGLVHPGAPDDQPPVGRWGVQMVAERLTRGGGQIVGQVVGRSSEVLEEVPALASVIVMLDQKGRPAGELPNERAELVIQDLVSAAVRQRLVLYDEPAAPRNQSRQQQRVLSVAGRVVVQMGARVYVVPVGEVDRAGLSVPLHLVPDQQVLVADAARLTKVPVAVKGGTGGPTFAAVQEMPGIAVDAARGDVTVDPGPFLEASKTVVIQLVGNAASEFARAGAMPSPADLVERVAEPARAVFQQLTGRAAKGIPMAIPVDVQARDEEGQVAVLPRVVLMDVPSQPIVKELERQREEQRRRHEEERARAAQRAAHTLAPPGGTDVHTLRQRVEERAKRNAELERKVTELEAQNALLRELVQGRRQRPPHEKTPPR